MLQEDPYLRAGVCRAMGKCCAGENNAAHGLCFEGIVDKLWEFSQSKYQIVRDAVPLALSGLSIDPLISIKIKSQGFLPVK